MINGWSCIDGDSRANDGATRAIPHDDSHVVSPLSQPVLGTSAACSDIHTPSSSCSADGGVPATPASNNELAPQDAMAGSGRFLGGIASDDRATSAGSLMMIMLEQ